LEKVTLKFNDPNELWEFRILIHARPAKIDLMNCILICDCGDAEIELATNAYNAVPSFASVDTIL
jgi:hypothetical protein